MELDGLRNRWRPKAVVERPARQTFTERSIAVFFVPVQVFSLCCKSNFARITSFQGSQMWQCLHRFTFYDFVRRLQLGLNESQLLISESFVSLLSDIYKMT